jgi:hypothetical protein
MGDGLKAATVLIPIPQAHGLSFWEFRRFAPQDKPATIL